ncbi:MAG: PCRF domain-containing protein, partial [Lachnospiraceae bacterium]|nr:PCRF domain-containing protein [Lachnospiraceae bacterium]
MFEKLKETVLKYEEITERLNNPGTADDSKKYMELLKEQGQLSPVVEAYRSYEENEKLINESSEMMKAEDDPELKALAKE